MKKLYTLKDFKKGSGLGGNMVLDIKDYYISYNKLLNETLFQTPDGEFIDRKDKRQECLDIINNELSKSI